MIYTELEEKTHTKERQLRFVFFGNIVHIISLYCQLIIKTVHSQLN